MGLTLSLLTTAGWTTGWPDSRIVHPEIGQQVMIWPNVKCGTKSFFIREFEKKCRKNLSLSNGNKSWDKRPADISGGNTNFTSPPLNASWYFCILKHLPFSSMISLFHHLKKIWNLNHLKLERYTKRLMEPKWYSESVLAVFLPCLKFFPFHLYTDIYFLCNFMKLGLLTLY